MQNNLNLASIDINQLVERALQEDYSLGDPTSNAIITTDLSGTAQIVARQEGVCSGLPIAKKILERVDNTLQIQELSTDGQRLEKDQIILEIKGSVRSILAAERTTLNFLQHLSGIATQTATYVNAVSGTAARIVDTRKTTPGLRKLEKYAVLCGGARNHRQSLGDGILIKDNHIIALKSVGHTISTIVKLARDQAPHALRIEIEVESEAEAIEAMEAGADVLLLDNMSAKQIQKIIPQLHNKVTTEASGGITLDSVREIAATGVDIISVGAITHSAPSLDLSLDIVTIHLDS
jgi:nicotinate-nucleotide pyrophosphorylase (carboxylating)